MTESIVRRPVVLSVLLGVFVAIAGYALDVLLVREGMPRLGALAQSNLLTGVIAGLAVWLLGVRYRERRQMQANRLQVIDQMNHHVRNALQVIVLYSAVNGELAHEVKNAIERIQWSLQEILTQLGDDADLNFPQPPSRLAKSA